MPEALKCSECGRVSHKLDCGTGKRLTSDRFNEWTDCVMVGHDWQFEGDDLMGEHQLQVWVCSKCNEWDVRESS